VLLVVVAAELAAAAVGPAAAGLVVADAVFAFEQLAAVAAGSAVAATADVVSAVVRLVVDASAPAVRRSAALRSAALFAAFRPPAAVVATADVVSVVVGSVVDASILVVRRPVALPAAFPPSVVAVIVLAAPAFGPPVALDPWCEWLDPFSFPVLLSVPARPGQLQLRRSAVLFLVAFSQLFAGRQVALQRPAVRSPLNRPASLLAKASALVPAELLCPEFLWHLPPGHAVAAPVGQQRQSSRGRSS